MTMTKFSKIKVIRKNEKHRKCFFLKLLLFIVCVVGGVYQVTEFLIFYWSYPEVIEMMIETEREALLPAVTVCDLNSISREIYCKDYPEYCKNITEEDSTCKDYPDYCKGGKNLTLVTKVVERFYFETPDFMKNYTRDVRPSFSSKGRWTEPFFYRYHSGAFSCFTLNSLVGNDNNTNTISLSHNSSMQIQKEEYKLGLFSYPDDRFYPWIQTGFYIHIHSPFVRVNPEAVGTFMKSGRNFIVHYRMEEEHLLPFPYSSNCINYIEDWKKNNKSGPKSQMSCRENCHKKAYCSYKARSIFRHDDYPQSYCDEKIRKEGAKFITSKKAYRDKIASCNSLCKPDCMRYKYHYTVQEAPPDPVNDRLGKRKHPYKTHAETTNELEARRGFIRVKIVLDEPEVLVLKHRPQYQDVELFSYIGGFLGLWLGVSFYSFANLFEKTFICTTYLLRHFQCLKHLKNFRRYVLEEEEIPSYPDQKIVDKTRL